ncbi:hypothetical protein K3556_08375 [Aliiroseovarius sp. M344]|uniref:hypothetical protein n=1 Tax=Aliiroseovarius sp. M344 TaxID=2867010 RepID=UPI0021AD5B86|nr:hypothetical protein [Aliiroseovarius sp. M344]UWQ15954.1 hypothetical protein K3556_08375 [Aliiroseovarius sp. M344]
MISFLNGVILQEMPYIKSDKTPLEADNGWNDMLIRLIKLIFFLAIIGLIGLTGFAFFGDMSPRTAPQSSTVTLNGGS